MKVAVNLHAFGNLFVHPFNYDNGANERLYKEFPSAELFYTDVYTNGGVPTGSRDGTGIQTVNYPANGEASDYMLAQLKIFAISPELGTDDEDTFCFLIKDMKVLKRLLVENYRWLIYAAESLMDPDASSLHLMSDEPQPN